MNKFAPKDFKQAKQFLLENNYSLELVKLIDNFNIVDLANLLHDAEQELLK